MRYKKIMILAILLVSLLAVSAVSAAENATSDVVDIEETTNEDVVSVESDQIILKENSVGTFTDLAKEIANANGKLDLNRDYTYSSSDSDYEEGITISKKITINGNGHTINGNNQARAFKIESSVTLNNIAFTKCYADFRGGAIYVNGDYCTIKGCSFDECHAQEGGAISIWAWNTVISDCSFDSCSANIGGAIRQQGCSGCTVSNSNFANCRSDRGGSAIYWGSSDKGTLSGCNFKNCYSDTQGAVYWFKSDYSTLSDCSFTYCSSYFEGGAIYLESNNCIIKGCTFFSPKKGQDDYKIIGVNNTIINGKASKIAVNKNNYYKYGSGELVATLTTDSGKAISGATVVININNEGHNLKTNSNGQVKLSVASLKPNTYAATIKFEGDNNYAPSSTTANVIISKMDTTLSANYDSASKNIVATVKDANGKAVSGLKVGFAIDGVKYVTTDANGQAKYSTSGLANKKYSVNVMAYGNEIYDDSNKVTVTFDLSKIATTLTAPDVVTTYNSGKNLVATLKDANGKAISGAKVTIKLGAVTETLTTNNNGQVSLTTNGLAPNTYTASITFAGDNTYASSSTTAKVTINNGQKQQAKVYLRNALYFVLQRKIVQVTLWDANNNPIAGKTVYINLDEYGLKYSGVTNANGDAYIRVGVGFGNHPATVSFEGDDQYNADSKTGRVRVIKETPSLMLPGAYTKFKATDKTKTIKVYLKDRYNKPLLLGTKVFVTINGQQYVGVTDLEGIATINLQNLNKAGTYDIDLYYTGNTAYNAVRKTTKITIV